jgi:hypothetical protein
VSYARVQDDLPRTGDGLRKPCESTPKGWVQGSMKKSVFLIGAVLLAVAVMASTASAAVNVKRFPVATFGDPDAASVTLRGGNFSGLGSVPAIANLTVNGTVTFDCANPQGHLSPGQNPVPAQPGLASQDLGNADHNGRGTINDLSATATAPPAPSAQEVGCGGGGSTQWTVVNPVVTVTGAHLEITQDGVVVFCRNYTEDGIGTAC